MPIARRSTIVVACACVVVAGVALAAADDWVVDRLDIRYDIQADGTIQATDAIDVNFSGAAHHGINRLVSARQRVREAWSAIDVQLQRRAALIPNLVEVVKGYASFERDTMQRIAEARGALGAAKGPQSTARASDDLSGAVRALVAVAEAYPTLKANERFAQLQLDLADTEDKIARARKYNGAVETYNIRVERIPSLLIAVAFRFTPAEFFSAGS